MAFPTTSILETFTGSNGTSPPNANWQNVINGIQIQGNQGKGTTNNASNLAMWKTSTFGPDCEVFATMAAATGFDSNNALVLYARLTTLVSSTFDGYAVAYLELSSDNIICAYRIDNGAYTQLGTNFIQTLSSGDALGLEIVGSGAGNIRVYRKPAGGSWDATPLITFTDSTYTAAGYIGMSIEDTSGILDDFGGGTISSGATTHTVGASLDSMVQKAGIVKTASLDSMIQRAGITKTAGLDAIIGSLKSSSLSLDALIQAAKLFGLNLDALISASKTAASGLDAIIQTYTPGQLCIKVSSTGRYLTYQDDTPFLLVADSPQGLLVDLSLTDMETYLADRESRGINMIQVHLIAGTTFGGRSNRTTYDGIAPFSDANLTPNESYFARVDAMLALAADHNIVVCLTAAESIDSKALFTTAGAANCLAFGQYLGSRYSQQDNIIWSFGNDFIDWTTGSSTANLCFLAVCDGIQDNDVHHLHTAWLWRDHAPWREEEARCLARESTAALYSPNDWDSRIHLDLVYTYDPPYDWALKSYNLTPAKPAHLGESNYQGEAILDVPTTTPLTIRKQNYWSLFSGAFGVTVCNNYTYAFDSGWDSHLGDQCYTDLPHLISLLNGRAWWDLIPDQSHTTLTAGYGTYDSADDLNISGNDYATCARTADGSLVLAYLPTSRQITIDMSRIAGSSARCRWYNPSSGAYTEIGTYATSGTRNFTPAAGDWVFVATSSVTIASGLDSLIQRTGIAQTTSLGALLQASKSATVGSDALVQAVKTGIISIDALAQALKTQTISADALIQMTKSGALSIDAFLYVALSSVAAIDACIQAAKTGTASLDALLVTAGESLISTSLDSLIQAIKSGTISLDAMIQTGRASTAGLDAILFLLGTQSVSMDALIQGVPSGTVSLDAVLQAVRGQTVTMDALIGLAGTGFVSMDAILYLLGSASAQLDSLLLLSKSYAVGMDAIIGLLVIECARMVTVPHENRFVTVPNENRIVTVTLH